MIYRPEHPKPQFMWENRIDLNGSRDFEIDRSVSGEARGLFEPKAYIAKKKYVTDLSPASVTVFIDRTACVYIYRGINAHLAIFPSA